MIPGVQLSNQVTQYLERFGNNRFHSKFLLKPAKYRARSSLGNVDTRKADCLPKTYILQKEV